MENENKILLIRSSRELINNGYIGYGWKKVKFKEYTTFKELIENGFKDIDYGRKKKQIKYFYELKENDLVVVPVHKNIAIGRVRSSPKEFDKNAKKHSSNRIKVDFFKDKKGNVYIPRSELNTDLQARLKIRRTIANLGGFREHIEELINYLKKGEIPTRDSAFIEAEEEAKKNFIEKLHKRLESSKNLGIEAGGEGIEKLIKEIFAAKDFDVNIPSKNSRKKGEDVDIIARKQKEFGKTDEKCKDCEKDIVYLIQAKHHKGETSEKGVHQLNNWITSDGYNDEYNDCIVNKVLITTARVSEKAKEAANDKGVTIVEGEEFATWIYENLYLLSVKTLNKLGISSIPTLV